MERPLTFSKYVDMHIKFGGPDFLVFGIDDSVEAKAGNYQLPSYNSL